MKTNVNIPQLVSSMEAGDITHLSGDEIIALGETFKNRAHDLILEYTS